MAVPKSTLYTCLWLMYLMTSCNSVEPHCSKFPYEEALLEKLVRLEFKVEQMDNSIRAVQENVIEEVNKLKKEREESVAFRKQLEEDIRQNSNKTQALVLNQGESVIEEIQRNLITFNQAFSDLAIAQNRSLDKLQEFAEASNIWFTAHGVSNLTPSIGETAIFKYVMTNQGSGYNSAKGIFTAPIAGLYLFSVQFCTAAHRFYLFAFYVDGTRKQATSIGTSTNACGTSLMSIALRKSAEVSVKCMDGGNVLKSDSYRWNIFSGVLIKPINND